MTKRWTLPEARAAAIISSHRNEKLLAEKHKVRGTKTDTNSPQSLRGPCESHTGGEDEGLAATAKGRAAAKKKKKKRAVTSKRAAIVAVVVVAVFFISALGGGERLGECRGLIGPA